MMELQDMFLFSISVFHIFTIVVYAWTDTIVISKTKNINITK